MFRNCGIGDGKNSSRLSPLPKNWYFEAIVGFQLLHWDNSDLQFDLQTERARIIFNFGLNDLKLRLSQLGTSNFIT